MVFRRAGNFLPVAQLRDEMDRLVSDFFVPSNSGPPARWSWTARSFPALNVWDEGDALYAEAEVPGMKSEELEISVVGSDLTICGHRGRGERGGVVYYRQERGTGEFNRVLRLPEEVEAGKVEATLADGVLLIKLPKAESAKPKKIKVSTAGK